MNQLHPDSALVPLLLNMVVNSVIFHLYTAPTVEPDLDAVIGDFTEENTFSYAPITVDPADFTTQGVSGHQGFITAGDITFTPVGGAWTVYGYYVTDAVTGDLLAFGFFDGAPFVATSINPVVLTPKMGNNSKFSA